MSSNTRVPKAVGAKFKPISDHLPSDDGTLNSGGLNNRWLTGYFKNVNVTIKITFVNVQDVAIFPTATGIAIRNDADTAYQNIDGENIISNKADGSAGFTVELDGTNKAVNIAGIKVLGIQGAVVNNAVAGTEVTTINTILNRLRAHGLIDT